MEKESELVGAGLSSVDGGQRERAVALLREALAGGPLSVAEMTARLARQGVNYRMLLRARQVAVDLLRQPLRPYLDGR